MVGEGGESFDAATVLESLREPVFAVDANRDVAFANARFLEIADLERAEAVGADYGLFDGLVEDGFEEFNRAVEAVLAGRLEDVRVEVEMCHPESAPVQRRLPAEARVARIRVDGERRGATVTLRDVTAREANRRALERQNERLEEFASFVSHDLRNPLGVAVGHLELARETGESSHFDAVERAHERMDSVVRGLLALAHDGEQASDPDPVSLPATVRRCRETVDADGLTLRVETESTVRADPDQLCHLLENLFRNVVEHAGPHSTVAVGDLDDGFFVADDGPGIAPEDRDRVLEGRRATDDDGETGLGLRIVGQVAAAHGWEVALTEAASGGARFEFTGVDVVE